MHEIIEERYPLGEWNIYGAQASDGDNWADDSPRCKVTRKQLLPYCQYYAYIEITVGHIKPYGTSMKAAASLW